MITKKGGKADKKGIIYSPNVDTLIKKADNFLMEPRKRGEQEVMIDTVTLLKKQKEYEQIYKDNDYHTALGPMKCKICRSNCGKGFGVGSKEKPCYCNLGITVHPDSVCNRFSLDAKEAKKQGVEI